MILKRYMYKTNRATVAGSLVVMLCLLLAQGRVLLRLALALVGPIYLAVRCNKMRLCTEPQNNTLVIRILQHDTTGVDKLGPTCIPSHIKTPQPHVASMPHAPSPPAESGKPHD